MAAPAADALTQLQAEAASDTFTDAELRAAERFALDNRAYLKQGVQPIVGFWRLMVEKLTERRPVSQEARHRHVLRALRRNWSNVKRYISIEDLFELAWLHFPGQFPVPVLWEGVSGAVWPLALVEQQAELLRRRLPTMRAQENATRATELLTFLDSRADQLRRKNFHLSQAGPKLEAVLPSVLVRNIMRYVDPALNQTPLHLSDSAIARRDAEITRVAARLAQLADQVDDLPHDETARQLRRTASMLEEATASSSAKRAKHGE